MMELGLIYSLAYAHEFQLQLLATMPTGWRCRKLLLGEALPGLQDYNRLRACGMAPISSVLPHAVPGPYPSQFYGLGVCARRPGPGAWACPPAAAVCHPAACCASGLQPASSSSPCAGWLPCSCPSTCTAGHTH